MGITRIPFFIYRFYPQIITDFDIIHRLSQISILSTDYHRLIQISYNIKDILIITDYFDPQIITDYVAQPKSVLIQNKLLSVIICGSK